MVKRVENRGKEGNKGANKDKSYNVGNSFNQKWNKENVNEKLDEMIELMEERNDTKKPIYSISKLLSEVKSYNRFPSYLREKFGNDEEIMNKLDYIYTTTEANLFEKGIDNTRVNGALVQFGLRAFHKRFDEQHINLKNEHTGDISITFVPPKDDSEDE